MPEKLLAVDAVGHLRKLRIGSGKAIDHGVDGRVVAVGFLGLALEGGDDAVEPGVTLDDHGAKAARRLRGDVGIAGAGKHPAGAGDHLLEFARRRAQFRLHHHQHRARPLEPLASAVDARLPRPVAGELAPGLADVVAEEAP